MINLNPPNKHKPTTALKCRISDLVMAGTPLRLIAEIVDLCEETIQKHYSRELKTAKAIAIERIAKTVYQQALNGDSKAQSLYLKTQGASQGWIEKHVIEAVSNDETQALQHKIKMLESMSVKDY